MIGVYGDISKVRETGFNPDIIYVDIDKIHSFNPRVIPIVWIPRAINIDEYVVDIYGNRRLFAFNNSGCIANPMIIERNVKAIDRMASLGYKEILLDAVRLPSPIDKLLFLTTCFCRYSIELYPMLITLREKIKEILHDIDLDELIKVLEDLANARALHVKNILSILYDEASRLDIDLSAAVFPYPFSRYMGQEPKILNRYLKKVHVMLYHKCSGAACLNTEFKSLLDTLISLGLEYSDLNEFIRSITGVDIDIEDIEDLDRGLSVEYIEEFMKLNRDIYGDKFIPILWLDNMIKSRLEGYISEYRNLDIFIS